MEPIEAFVESAAERSVSVPHILLIESDTGIADFLQRVIVREMRLPFMHAQSGRSAFLATRVLVPSVMLVNQRLVDGDGIVLYDQLCRKPLLQNVPTIVMSTHIAAHRARLQERRLKGIALPVEIDEFIFIVGEHLQSLLCIL